jgi:DNA-binding CsgD family transcriptional regulator
MTERTGGLTGVVIIIVMIAQAACAGYFLYDVTQDYLSHEYGAGFAPHLMMEGLANLVLVAAIALEAVYLRGILRRQAHTDRVIEVASGALRDAMMAYFDDWGLSPAEAVVAEMVIRGKSISDIAAARGSAEGTIKTQLNAVYRKAGVSGRSQLVSILIEDLLDGPLSNVARPSAAAG